MTEKNSLRIVEVQNNASSNQKKTLQRTSREEIQAKFERKWLLNPEEFNPLKNCSERERLDRTMVLIEKHLNLKGKKAADLGCGSGELACRLALAGANVDAVDAASNALKQLKKKGVGSINAIQDCLPTTLLKDDSYDLVICTDVIAYLNEKGHRLLFNELTRLAGREGYVVCSTPTDIHSEDAVDKFIGLAQTEINIIDITLSYHRLYISLRNILKTPAYYVEAGRNNQFFQEELKNKSVIGKWWFKINSLFPFLLFWKGINCAAKPVDTFIRQNRTVLLLLEKATRLVFSDSGISHVIFIGKQLPLSEPSLQNQEVFERKQKKSVWE